MRHTTSDSAVNLVWKGYGTGRSIRVSLFTKSNQLEQICSVREHIGCTLEDYKNIAFDRREYSSVNDTSRVAALRRTKGHKILGGIPSRLSAQYLIYTIKIRS
ncbi:hypothetical protein TNCV_4819411 [Trichonephila clavipes]|nr:hypothetical protein TNCV_4819411 [Trichonephila clavipes]